MPEAGSRRNRLQPRSEAAFAPAAITNFFRIHYSDSGTADSATGGGYVLSRGTSTKATLLEEGSGMISTVVNGDPAYNARTTRRAVGLLLSAHPRKFGGLFLDQVVDTPIGSGFGASGASAISAVYAVSQVLGISRPKSDLALFAHRAEIIEQTGLGTVSVVFDATGAGAITVAGEPGVARFVNVRVPKGVRLVTAYLAPYDKKDALSSKKVSDRINQLGEEALKGFLSDPSFDRLAEEGERFSEGLGLESPEVKKMKAVAKSAGASHSSQNMIGYAIHATVDEDRAASVANKLNGLYPRVRVDLFDVGAKAAGVVQAIRR